MARKKVMYELITDERARKTTFKKRKVSLLKKVNELQTLCGVDACAIIYSKFDSDPEVWPSPNEAHHVVERFSALPALRQTQNMIDREILLKKNVNILEKKVEKDEKKNRALYMEGLMMKCLLDENLHGETTLEDINDLASFLDDNIKLLTDRVEKLQELNSALIVADKELLKGTDQAKENHSI